MTTTAVTKAKDFTWETLDGQTEGNVTVDGIDYDIWISERVTPTMWNRATNVRAWALSRTDENTLIAKGEADGLRNSKRDALAALNAHLGANA